MNGTLYSQDQKELASLTELRISHGTSELQGDTRTPKTDRYFTCRSDQDLSSHLFARSSYYIEMEDGSRYSFTVSSIGDVVSKVDEGLIKVRVKNHA